MQFTPLFFQEQADVCITATSNGAVSGSYSFGPYTWDYHHFTASDQTTYDTASLYQFNLTQGYTRDGIILLVGGGGAGALQSTPGASPAEILNGAGGGAEYILVEDFFLAKTGTGYNVQVGHGGSSATYDDGTGLGKGNGNKDIFCCSETGRSCPGFGKYLGDLRLQYYKDNPEQLEFQRKNVKEINNRPEVKEKKRLAMLRLHRDSCDACLEFQTNYTEAQKARRKDIGEEG